ncbi:MAG TPA: PadR family transcriptional regulator [Candidatus Limnocylindrales bacterium]
MSRVSTLGYALLSLLTRGPATGYDLTRRMRQPIGYFWVAQHSQIYPELAKLAAAGHVDVQEGDGPGPRAKKTYTLTEGGRAALASWLPERPAFTPRSELVLKAYAVNSADPVAMSTMYQAIADQAGEQVKAWDTELKTMADQGYDDPAHPRFGNYAVLKMGLESQRVTHHWATWLAARLREVVSGHDGAD